MSGPADPTDTAEAPDPAPENASGEVGLHRRIGRALARSKIAFVAWVALITLTVVPLVYRSEAKVGPGTFSASIAPALHGTTEVAIPPIGSLSARTHVAPVRLGFELREVDVLDAIDPSNRPGLDGIEAEVRDDIPGAILHMIVVLAGTSAVVGLAAAALFPGKRSFGRVLAATLISPGLILALAAPALIDFDVEQLEKNPELNGPIGSAEVLFAKVGSLDTRFGDVSSRTEILASKITGLYSAATNNEISRSDGEVAILHVSDLHLNPVGLALARDLAIRFDVDAVVDTGDITSFGFEPEAGFVDVLDGFPKPYYVIAGNHDSESVRRQLAGSDSFTYLDGETARIGDVKILGVGDPTVTALRKIPREELDRTYRRQFRSTERLVEREKPDLLLVHNPLQLEPVLGKVPVAAAGHLHKTELDVIDGTVVAVVGSSGATGLGNLLVEKGQPYRFEILRFVNAELVAVDEISLDDDTGDFTLQRRLISSDETDTAKDLPKIAEGQEPSKEQVEEDDPSVLDRVSSMKDGSLLDEEPNSSATTASAPTTRPAPTTSTDDPRNSGDGP